LVGKAPHLVGKAPHLVGKAPHLVGKAPHLVGKPTPWVGKTRNLRQNTSLSAQSALLGQKLTNYVKVPQIVLIWPKTLD